MINLVKKTVTLQPKTGLNSVIGFKVEKRTIGPNSKIKITAKP